MPTLQRFPKADPVLAQHFYSLFGRALLSQMVDRRPFEILHSMRLALLAHESGVPVGALLDRRTHACGPKRRARAVVKKR